MICSQSRHNYKTYKKLGRFDLQIEITKKRKDEDADVSLFVKIYKPQVVHLLHILLYICYVCKIIMWQIVSESIDYSLQIVIACCCDHSLWLQHHPCVKSVYKYSLPVIGLLYSVQPIYFIYCKCLMNSNDLISLQDMYSIIFVLTLGIL